MTDEDRREITVNNAIVAYGNFRELMGLEHKKSKRGYLDRREREKFDRCLLEVDGFFKSVTI